ncbi:MAG: hypothetical protein Q7T49_00675 [bacterium]|nr:hypothetical protein [bacterium]
MDNKNNVLTIVGLVGLVIIVGILFFNNTNNGNVGANPPNSAEGAPEGSIHNLPLPQAVAAVKSLAAQEAKVSEGEVLILTAFEREWSDSCLGLGGIAESCAQVITPGWEVTLQVKGKEIIYRTNAESTTIRTVK